ncbi:MAG TPA: hypothetical protein VJU61_03305, partial [Polyangiaceae bacterium]|nr:hypothetical protein [Polyangiaceae bacterium]
LASFPAGGDEPSRVRLLQTRLLELGLLSYVLRQAIVRTILDLPPSERNPGAITERCMIPFRRRARRAWWIIAVALLSSLAAILTLRFAAHRLWPARELAALAAESVPTDG